jgi:hypothetical protein
MPCWPLVLPLLLSTVQAVARRVAYQTFNHGTPTYHLGHAAMHPLQSCLAAVWLVLVLACLPPGFSPPVHGPCMPHGCLQVQHVELHGMCQFVLGGLCVGVSVPSVDGLLGCYFACCAVLELDITFHMNRRTGRLSRILERGMLGMGGQWVVVGGFQGSSGACVCT